MRFSRLGLSLTSLWVFVVASGRTSPVASQSVGEVFDEVRGAVAVVLVSQTEYPFASRLAPVSVEGLGSAVLISPTELITAAHVVQAADAVTVLFPDGERLEARVASSRPAYDVALLELARPASAKPAPLGDSNEVRTGDQVMVVGAPLGQAHTLTVGHVSAKRSVAGAFGSPAPVDFIQTDAAINQGNSGGPLLNLRGEVVGIVTHILSFSGGFEGLGYAVTSNMARRVLLQDPPFWIGADVLPLTGALATLLNVPPPGTGLLVQRVATGSLAERLGLVPSTIPVRIAEEEVLLGGDILLGAMGISLADRLSNVERIVAELQTVPAGGTVTVRILRQGQVLELSAVR